MYNIDKPLQKARQVKKERACVNTSKVVIMNKLVREFLVENNELVVSIRNEFEKASSCLWLAGGYAIELLARARKKALEVTLMDIADNANIDYYGLSKAVNCLTFLKELNMSYDGLSVYSVDLVRNNVKAFTGNKCLGDLDTKELKRFKACLSWPQAKIRKARTDYKNSHNADGTAKTKSDGNSKNKTDSKGKTDSKVIATITYGSATYQVLDEKALVRFIESGACKKISK